MLPATTPDPEPDPTPSHPATAFAPSQRLPHAGHLLLLLLFLALAFFAALLPLLLHTPTAFAALAAQAAAYLLTLATAWFVFPHLWQRSFLSGIGWNATSARWPLLLLGLALGYLSQFVETFLPAPPQLPIEQLFRTPGLIWPLAIFGVLLGPLFEEIFFRGFLLPAAAIAFDWSRLPRTGTPAEALARLDRWRATTAFSPPALVVASVVTSILFALVHAAQLGFAWPNVALLACVSLVLCWVRLHWRSVAATTLVHGSYNLSVFATLYVSSGGFHHLDKL